MGWPEAFAKIVESVIGGIENIAFLAVVIVFILALCDFEWRGKSK